MATLEVTKKVSYIGVWLEDVFTDQVVQNIAAHAKAAKGKKVKLVMNSMGLRIKRNKLFQEKLTEYYPLVSVKTVTRNPLFSFCVMFVLTDPKKRYRILALKCPSEGEAIHLVSMYTQIRRDGIPVNTELKKRDNGNWTLRDRSTHNANRHLAEVFNEQQQKAHDEKSDPVNGDIPNHVPILDRSKIQTTEASVPARVSYIKRSESNNNNVKANNGDVVINDGDDYVIETEVSPYPYSKPGTQTTSVYVSQSNGQTSGAEPEVTAVREDLDTLTHEVHNLKNRLANMQNPDHTDGPKYPNTLPSKPTVQRTMVSSRPPEEPIYSEPRVYRGPPKTFTEATLVSSRRYRPGHDPWAAHRRMSGNFVLPAQLNGQLRSGTESLRSYQRVAFDNESVISAGSTRGRNKSRKSNYSVSRPIEQVYGRQPLMRHNSAHNLNRPVSVHVVGRNELALYQPNRYRDVAL